MTRNTIFQNFLRRPSITDYVLHNVYQVHDNTVSCLEIKEADLMKLDPLSADLTIMCVSYDVNNAE
jgi:hypothetical protein